MSKTIINIKNIIRIIIGVLVIFSMLKSCAKALTITSINNMLDDMVNNKPANYYKSNIRTMMKQSNVQNELNNKAGDYKNIAIFYNTATPACQVYLYNTPSNLSISNDYKINQWLNSGYTFHVQNGNIVYNQQNITGTTIGSGSRLYYSGNNNNQNYYTLTGIITGVVTGPGSSASQFLGWQNYVENPLVFGNLHSTQATFENEQVQVVQTLYSYSNTPIENFLGYTERELITFTLTNTKTNQKKENTFIWNENAYIGRNSNKSFYASDLGDYIDIGIDTRLITFNTIYNLKAEQGDYEKEVKIVFLPMGTTIENGSITSIPSGDFSYNVQDSTNDIIGNQNQNQEDNQSFIQNLYNNLLQPSGEEIRTSLEETLNTLELPSGEKEMAMAGLDIITSNPNDFIISWTPKPTHFSIKGQQLQSQLQIETPTNSINFSQMERENEDLHEAMTYARAILSFSVFVLFFKDLWNTLMATLGVSTQVYEKDQEEKARINRVNERNEENIKQAYERQRYREWLRGHSK